MKIYMKLVYQYMAIVLNFQTTSNHFHPLQGDNCDSNSRLVVDEDDNGKFGLERVKHQVGVIFTHLKIWIAVAKHNLKWVKN